MGRSEVVVFTGVSFLKVFRDVRLRISYNQPLRAGMPAAIHSVSPLAALLFSSRLLRTLQGRRSKRLKHFFEHNKILPVVITGIRPREAAVISGMSSPYLSM